MAPNTYRQLQQFIIERRRMQQHGDDGASSSRGLVGTAEDLAAKLRAFASEGVVLKHIIEFALPPKKRANAAEVNAPELAYNVTLSQDTAQAMADSFFEFVEQEQLQQHLSRMSAGQILVLCIFHRRLSW